MSFQDRKTPGEEYLKELCRKFKRKGFTVALTGAEHTVPEFHKTIQKYKGDDYTTRWVRYQPDGAITDPAKEKTYYIEAKHSNSIEKDAYLTYMDMQMCGCKIIICIKARDGTEYYVPVEKLVLIDGNETSMRFPKDKRMPVDNDGWLSPRLWPDGKYFAWKKRFPEASGTPFKYFDFGAMGKYERRPEAQCPT